MARSIINTYQKPVPIVSRKSGDGARNINVTYVLVCEDSGARLKYAAYEGYVPGDSKLTPYDYEAVAAEGQKLTYQRAVTVFDIAEKDYMK